MNTESTIEIEAPATVVWRVFTDAERWPDWTESVTRIVAKDGAGIEVGKRFAIKQPRLPNLVWKVTAVEPGRSWVWEHHTPGNRTSAVHVVEPLGPTRTRVTQRIEQRGPTGVITGFALRRMTRRSLELEANGLKARSERERRARDAAPA